MRSQQPQESYVTFAQVEEDIVVLRVMGRGDFAVSPQLKSVSDKFNSGSRSARFILDLESCPAMDSTFMGEIASIALHQRACGAGQMAVVNASPVTRNQLEKLGLKHMLDLHGDPPSAQACANLEFEQSPAARVSRFEQIAHMIECHRALIEADSGNEVKFRAVLQSLHDSLARENAKREE